ncbi:MAG: lysylphosphatidylglycerol synthase transmembrane domain-containing protein [Chloroflexi bacterium]|nr:lysylphosphatidylglycerol synthase transmembrane domain-containing protein [Chloroflexota bacterium]
MNDPAKTNDRSPGVKRSRRQLLARAASIAITVVLLADLIGRVNWAEFDQTLGRIALSSWIGALLAYLALNLFRALRFRILLDKRDSPWRILIPITLYHNFLVRALPFKLGELSYIVLLRSRLNYTMEEGLSSLFGARILELLIIVMVFASSIPASAEQLAAQRDELTLAIAVTFAISVIGLYFGGSVIRTVQRSAQPILTAAEGRRPSLAAGLNSRLAHLGDEMDRIRQPRLFLTALFTTCFTYTSSFLTNYLLLRALGVDVPLPVFIAIISLGMFASAFPFTVSGFGVVEGAWLVGLTQFAGMPDADAAAAGFLLHGFQIFAAALYGLLGYLLIHISAPLPAKGVTSSNI